MDAVFMTHLFADRAFARGFRAGLRSVVLGRSEALHPIVRREVGSLANDRDARYRDMEMFAVDVRLGQRHVHRQ